MVESNDGVRMKLCKPDDCGNYWLGGSAKAFPAILKGGDEWDKEGRVLLKREKHDLRHRWFISTADGVVMYGADVRYFSSAQSALDYLEEMTCRS